VDTTYGVVHLLVCCCSQANHPLRPQMSVELKGPAQETKRLERLLNDPAGWTGVPYPKLFDTCSTRSHVSSHWISPMRG